MKLANLFQDAMSAIRANNIPESALRLLLADTFGMGLAELNTQLNVDLKDAILTRWNQRLERLLRGEPPQYISGQACFYGLQLKVCPGVLIPRPETEGLVELVLERLHEHQLVLDCCCGSGAIALAIKHMRSDATVHASDLSSEAVTLAKQNAADLMLDISIYECDLFPTTTPGYDLIVCNPPYISDTEYQRLDPSVRDHEPALALRSGNDGLDHMRRLVYQAPSHLTPGGLLCLEHGETQRESIVGMASSQGWKLEYAGADLAGKARYLIFSKPKSQPTTPAVSNQDRSRGYNG